MEHTMTEVCVPIENYFSHEAMLKCYDYSGNNALMPGPFGAFAGAAYSCIAQRSLLDLSSSMTEEIICFSTDICLIGTHVSYESLLYSTYNAYKCSAHLQYWVKTCFDVDMKEAFLHILVKRNIPDILSALFYCNQTS